MGFAWLGILRGLAVMNWLGGNDMTAVMDGAIGTRGGVGVEKGASLDRWYPPEQPLFSGITCTVPL